VCKLGTTSLWTSLAEGLSLSVASLGTGSLGAGSLRTYSLGTYSLGTNYAGNPLNIIIDSAGAGTRNEPTYVGTVHTVFSTSMFKSFNKECWALLYILIV
jgi:hypothetical protein